MTDITPQPTSAAPPSTDTRTLAIVVYGLYIGAVLTGGLAGLAGVILAYVKRDEARGTVWESHFQNMIAVFWISFLLGVLALAIVLPAAGSFIWTMFATNGNPPAQMAWLLVLVPAFSIAGVVFLVWYLFRVVRGLLRAIDGKAY